jgi:hypothetical protein
MLTIVLFISILYNEHIQIVMKLLLMLIEKQTT